MPSDANQPLDDRLLTPHETAAQLGVSINTLTNWRNLYGQERLRYIKLNPRDVRYRRSAVLAYIAALEAATPQAIRDAAEKRARRAAA